VIDRKADDPVHEEKGQDEGKDAERDDEDPTEEGLIRIREIERHAPHRSRHVAKQECGSTPTPQTIPSRALPDGRTARVTDWWTQATEQPFGSRAPFERRRE
jgi:hypothetical protein